MGYSDQLYVYANRVPYWPNGPYSRAYECCEWPWLVRKTVSGRKVSFLCCAEAEAMEHLWDLSIDEVKALSDDANVRYLHMAGVNVECLLVHGDEYINQCDLVAAAQYLTGYWVVSSRKNSIPRNATIQTACLDNGHSTQYWFARDLVVGRKKEFCLFCNRKHDVFHRRPIQVWYAVGTSVESRTEFSTGGTDCFDRACEFSKKSFSLAWQETDHNRRELKCLSKARKQLKSLRSLLREPSKLASPKASKSPLAV